MLRQKWARRKWYSVLMPSGVEPSSAEMISIEVDEDEWESITSRPQCAELVSTICNSSIDILHGNDGASICVRDDMSFRPPLCERFAFPPDLDRKVSKMVPRVLIDQLTSSHISRE